MNLLISLLVMVGNLAHSQTPWNSCTPSYVFSADGTTTCNAVANSPAITISTSVNSSSVFRVINGSTGTLAAGGFAIENDIGIVAAIGLGGSGYTDIPGADNKLVIENAGPDGGFQMLISTMPAVPGKALCLTDLNVIGTCTLSLVTGLCILCAAP